MCDPPARTEYEEPPDIPEVGESVRIKDTGAIGQVVELDPEMALVYVELGQSVAGYEPHELERRPHHTTTRGASPK